MTVSLATRTPKKNDGAKLEAIQITATKITKELKELSFV